ncbi:Ger(x)C family spore germination protein [Halobacillus salinarum]|uniref:Ger(X)C family spore germination protein n=1 Tax=Halobacillus salinarum TaxID=2932257 RepID=A0ABY4EJA8_9BACI|nr:Ger(x)C family spore germination protein [Halobacillus salinarum]UOQ43607.1 Ger(x)C family spore germination protein [Halobacillus salinarum]
MKKALCMLISLFLLTGCWDQRQFKDIKLVLTKAFDLTEDGDLHETVSIPSVQRGGEGPGPEHIQIVSAEADNVREARERIDEMISQSFDPSKLKVILLGEELAQKGIYPILDDFYRNPRNNLNAYLGIVEGEAGKAVSIKNQTEPRISTYISGILESNITSTHFTGKNLQLICSDLLSPGKDFTLPYLKVLEESQLIKYDGLALFHDENYTGVHLTPEQSLLLMLLEGYRGQYARITKKIGKEGDNPLLDYISINVMKADQKLKIDAKDSEVKVTVRLNLKARIVEYPKNHLDSYSKVEKVNKRLSEVLTKDAKEIIDIVQEANSDVFGIGRRVMAYKPDVWDRLDWNEEFPDIEFEPKVTVEIQELGIIN